MLINSKRSCILLHGLIRDEFLKGLLQEKAESIVVLEGRPHLSGAKILCAKLLKNKITPTLISDNMSGFLFFKDCVKEVWLAYQEKNEQGALCDCGGLILGVLAKRHGVSLRLFPSGRRQDLMAKERDIFYFNKMRVAPKGVKGYVPLLEWVPNEYITKAN
ncbi:MAG: hypothetical protein WC676_08190 [Candidatus Omnitrophota bacterium]